MSSSNSSSGFLANEGREGSCSGSSVRVGDVVGHGTEKSMEVGEVLSRVDELLEQLNATVQENRPDLKAAGHGEEKQTVDESSSHDYFDAVDEEDDSVSGDEDYHGELGGGSMSSKWKGSGSAGTSSASAMSDYIDSEDDWQFASAEDSEEQGGGSLRRKRPDFPAFNPYGRDPVIELGMLFTGATEFKRAVAILAMKTQRGIVWARNHKNWVKAVCSGKNCPWQIYGSFNEILKSFQVKTFVNEHKCNKNFKPRIMTTKLIGDLYRDLIIKKPFIKTEEIAELVKADFEIDVNVSMVRRAKKEVLDDIALNFGREYHRLWEYAEVLRATNPGTSAVLKADVPNADSVAMFKRFYVCFGVLKKGWKRGCSPYIGLDGCFLKSAFKGELLCAVSRDGNNQMYPVAWAVVEVECTATWSWFVGLLREDLSLGSGYGLTLMTDQQKGLENAIREILPDAEHRFCARHLYSNWLKRGNRGQYKKVLFWGISKAYSLASYEKALERMRLHDSAALDDLLRIPRERWCRAFFQNMTMTELVDNNMSECFNNVLGKCRRLPIISMLEKIHVDTMDRIAKKRAGYEQWNSILGPRVWKVLDFNGRIATLDCNVVFNGASGYEVQHGENRYVVHLDGKQCSCGKYGLCGIPCEHAVAAIRHRGDEVETYVSSWYHMDTYILAYDNPLEPVPGMHDWPHLPHLTPLEPPEARIKRGRPKLMRRKDPFETGRRPGQTKLKRKGAMVYNCTNCGEEGHNSRGCPISRTYQRGLGRTATTTADLGSARATANSAPGGTATANITTTVTASVTLGQDVFNSDGPVEKRSTDHPRQRKTRVAQPMSKTVSNKKAPMMLVDAEGRVLGSLNIGRLSPNSRAEQQGPAYFKPGLARAEKLKQIRRKRLASAMSEDWDVPLASMQQTRSLTIGRPPQATPPVENPPSQSSQTGQKDKGKGKAKVQD